MDWVFDSDSWSKLSRHLGLGGSSSRSASVAFPSFNISKISDHVFEVGTKPENPSVEVIFFHGLQLEDSNQPYMAPWVSRDKSELWLNWITDEFPNARILVVTYDASIKRTEFQGNMDMYVTCENLLHDLTAGRRAAVGEAGCPIILVGHCLGSLVMKELCVRAASLVSDKDNRPFERFLENVKGFLCYASPHHGSELPDCKPQSQKGTLFKDTGPLNTETGRRNEEFRKLRRRNEWKTVGVGEGRPGILRRFEGHIVPEASSRHDMDKYYTVDADHFNVCRPESKTCNSYTMLADLIYEIMNEDEAAVPFSNDLIDNIFVGLEKSVEAIQQKLVLQSRVAVVGMGGIGKTTLVRAVFQRIQKDFQYSCFYEDVKNSMAERESPRRLRENIAKQFVDERGRSAGGTFQWNELRGKRVLVVLDDVISEEQIQVMTANDGFHKESRVIITARNKGFIRKARLGFDIYEVDKLSPGHSRELFCLCAFGKKDSPADFHRQVEDIVKKCEGLPLALTVTGKYLYSEGKSLWEEAFTRLHEAKSLNGEEEDGLWSLLRTSVDSLAYEEKEMFLDVAVCFHGEKVLEVKEVWEASNWASPEIGWRNLLDRHLVKEQHEIYTYVYMHEVLRDLGRKIAGRTRLFVSDLHLVDTFSNQEATDVKVVKGNMQELDQSRDNLLCRLTKLKVLWLEKHYYNLSVQEDVCRELAARNQSQRIGWNWSALKEVLFARVWPLDNLTLTKICGFERLQVLNISWSKFDAIPAEIGRLHRLQKLDLFRCDKLKGIPAEIGRLRSLEDLNMSFCSELVALPAAIGGLVSLRILNMAHCWKLVIIPAEIGRLHNLQKWDISSCSKMREIPAEIGRLHNLQKWDISSCSELREIPAEIGELLSLRVLNMSCCDAAPNVLAEISRLKKLQDLDIKSFWTLTAIPAEIGRLHILQNLNISSCESLVEISAEIGRLKSLCVLKMSRCTNLVRIPAEMGALQSLCVLNMSRCTNLRRIPTEIGGLQKLRVLKISYCENLLTIPAEIGGLQSLQDLNMSCCQRLVSIPAEIGRLQSLQKLNIFFCWNLEAIPAEFGGLRSLRDLDVSSCAKLVEIPAEIGGLQRLQKLNISYCSGLKEIPAEIGGLQSLKDLDMAGCKKLTAIPAAIGGLHNLQNLRISSSAELEVIPAEIGRLQSLQELSMSNCTKLTAIPAEIGGLHNLRRLYISECSGLEALPVEIGGLRSLRTLMMFSCINLRTIPAEIGLLQNLEYLDMSNCSKLIAIPAEMGGLQSLSQLNISYCDKLIAIPAEIGGLPSLRELKVYGNSKLVIPPEVLHVTICG